jgi:tryptophan-rich sensory protein
MAVAAWLVWRKGISMPGVTLALTLFLIQLTLNGLWSYIFFGARSIGGALVDILLLLIVLSATAWVFWRQSQAAGLLLLPYLAWVAFASALNFTIWRLNP